MKKIAGITLLIAFLGFGFTSCKKCVTCSYEYEWLGEKKVVSFPEECGKTKDIDEFKEEKEAEAKRMGSTLTCVEE